MEGKWSHYCYYLLDFSQQSKSFTVAVLPFLHPSLLGQMVWFFTIKIVLWKKKKYRIQLAYSPTSMNLILEHREMHSGEDEFERREKLLEIYCCFSGYWSLFPMILKPSLLLFWDESVLYLFHAFANFVLFFFFSYYCHLHSCSPPFVGTSSLLPFPQPHPFTVLRTWALLKMWKTLNLW